ncbi:head completion/stabilization protein [Aeromonas hydrophila]|uniref:head completion/stabilization protein n=1 Tax=Aeromonas hydrophila TaxID=644 RepID=UPI003D26250B
MFAGKQIDYSDSTITNDGFWPDVVVAHFEQARATPAELDAQTIQAALLAAVEEINLQLEQAKHAFQAKGYQCAGDVPGPSIKDGHNAVSAQYLAAVFARAKAALIPEFASVTERATANNQAERAPSLYAQLLAESQQLVRSIKGKRRASAALI